MKRTLFIICALLFVSAGAFAQFGAYSSTATDASGHRISSPTVKVCAVTDSACSTPVTIYSDVNSTALANPFTGDTQGNYQFFATSGNYTVQVAKAGYATYSYPVVIAQPVDGSPIAPSSVTLAGEPVRAATSPGSVNFGDSVTCGAGAGGSASCNSLGYAYLMAGDFGGTNTNYGTSGDMAADMSRKVHADVNPQYSRNPTYTMMIGINDSGRYTTNTALRAVYQAAHLASATWLAVPQQNKVFAQACAQTGSWSNDDTIRTGLEISSTTSGSTASCTITTTGGPIYLAYHVTDGNGGTASASIDGASQGSLSGFASSAIATINGTTDTIVAVRYPVAAGTHTVLVTVTSATNAGNKFELSWIGTPPTQGVFYAPPRVLIGGVHRAQNDANPTYTADFNTMAKANVTTLVGDGLNVFFVDIRSYINATTDMYDTYHPNAGGHRKVADGYEFVAQPAGGGAGGTFSTPLSVGSGTPSDPSAYNNFNPAGTIPGASTWGAGINVFSKFNNVYGLDFGYDTVNSKNATRRYAPANGEISDCFHTSGTLPTAQSDLVNCPYIATADGKVTMKTAVSAAPIQVASGTPTDPRNYNDLNTGDRLPNSTTWAVGVTLFSNFSNIVGYDFGYDSVSTKVGPRVFMPANEEFCVATHSSGVQPANQSDLACKFIVDGLAGAVTAQATTVSTLKVGANGSTLNTILTGTATLTYTAIAAQTCQEQPVTVTNSSTTNFGVTASPRATLGNTNVSWSAWVSASGTVQVRVCNPTAGSITPSAVAWGVTVTQ